MLFVPPPLLSIRRRSYSQLGWARCTRSMRARRGSDWRRRRRRQRSGRSCLVSACAC